MSFGIILLIAALLTITASIWITSERKPKSRTPIQNRRNATRLKEEGKHYIQHLASIDRVADALEATKNQEQTDDDKRALREKVTIGLLIFTVIFTGLADIIFYWTLTDSHTNAAEQIKRLDSQLKLMQASSTQTDAQVAATKDLASAAKDQAAAARDAVTAAHDNIVASERAWVGPSSGTIDKVPVKNSDIKLSVIYQNTGREPARAFMPRIETFIATQQEISSRATALKILQNLASCKSMQPVSGTQVVYPAIGFSTDSISPTIDKSQVTDELVSGSSVIYIIGCFAYETFGTSHYSAFCFFYKKDFTQVPYLNFCPGGSDAD